MPAHISEPAPLVRFLYLFQDDPRKSTMKKLERFHLATRTDRKGALRSLVLSHAAEKYLMPSDHQLILKVGITVIEGSWNRDELLQDERFRHGRRLPPLMASNPVNYGKWNRLSSVEAVSASLIITGFREMGEHLLSKFNWGENFIALNRWLLDEYSRCTSREDIEKTIAMIA